MDSPGEDRREQFAKQPKLARQSIAPAPAARFGRSATGQRGGISAAAVDKGTSLSDPMQRRAVDSPKDFLPGFGSSTQLYWCSAPQNVLVIKKYRDRQITQKFKEIVRYLVEEKGLKVYVESKALAEKDIQCDVQFAAVRTQLVSWCCEDEDCLAKMDDIDFVVCLGGDGTLLYVSSLFQKSVPPILAFHLGSLGFLTPLDLSQYKRIITDVIKGEATLTLRSRLDCVIHSGEGPASPAVNGRNHLEFERRISTPSPTSPKPEMHFPPLGGGNDVAQPQARFRRTPSIITNKTVTEQMLVLNEVVIDRGQSAYLSNLEMYCNGIPITDVQGDGLIVATPTGSTAYAAAAGASMVHPNVQAMVVTPICPHSLSFRPIMVPGGVKIEVKIPMNARGTGAVSCDGKNRQVLYRGDRVEISMSIFPLPCIDGVDHISDWFTSLSTCLHWNARAKQKQFDPEVEDEDATDGVETIPEE